MADLNMIIGYAEEKLSKLHSDEKDKDYIGLMVEVGFLKGVVELLKEKQAKIKRLKTEKDEAYEKGFKDGQNNILEAQAEGR